MLRDMSTLPQIYVINMDRSTDRLQRISTQLAREGLEFIRIPGVDMAGRDPGAEGLYSPRKAQRVFGRDLTSGEVGCYLGHLAALRAVVAGNADRALVLEDDAEIPAGFAEDLANLTAALDHPEIPYWECVNLGKVIKEKYRIPLVDFAVHGGAVVQLHRTLVMTDLSHALIWTKAGAKALLDARSVPVMPWDHAVILEVTLRHSGLATLPPVVDQTGNDSEIDMTGVRRGERDWAGWWRKWPLKWRQRIAAERTRMRDRAHMRLIQSGK